jgi:hypothetical protein
MTPRPPDIRFVLTAKKIQPTNVSICCYQVYYFDNKFFPNDTPKEMHTHRMQFYGADTFPRMVMADTCGLVGTNPTRVFGAAKVIATRKAYTFFTY